MVPRNTRASDERRNSRDRRGKHEPDNDDDRRPQTQVLDVLTGQPATTKTGKPRQRITWNKDMNKTVMHAYYKSTKLETLRTGYRIDLYRIFMQIYPQFENKITTQRLADQKRAIVTNNLLTSIEIENIKKKVAVELENNIEHSRIEEHNNTQNIDLQTDNQADENNNAELSPNRNQIITNPNPRNDTINLLDQIESEMQANKLKWEGIDPTLRPRIPKLIMKKYTANIIEIINNQILPTHLNNNSTIEDIHSYIYISAITTIIINNQQTLPQNKQLHTPRKPKWQIRIENKINNFRKDLGRLTQYKKGNRSNNIVKYLEILKQKHKKPIEEIFDIQKQKLKVYAARLARYKESNQRKIDNKLFINKEKIFYKQLNKTTAADMNPPTKEQITLYWKEMWSTPIQHDNTAHWIYEEEKRQKDLQQQNDIEVSTEQLTEIINKTHNWKCPGVDNIQNFWYKKLTSAHQHIARAINEIINQPQKLPPFLTIGKTYIKPKNTETTNPSNYRPITCLPTLYKIITSTISNKIYTHLSRYNILTNEQKGCKKNSRGCKEQLIIDTVVMKQTTTQKRSLHTCYIDYQKAFDSVPHSWLLKVLQLYKIHPKLIHFLTTTMFKWKTSVILTTPSNTITTEEIPIRRGIFQGDSLSALWFCLSLNPLSNALNNTTYGFNIKYEKATEHRINHLLYMDDIKLYASTHVQLKNLLKFTEQFSTDIRMKFGISKCKAQHVERGRWIEAQPEKIGDQIMDNLQENETYKYLGFQQSTKLDHTFIKKQLTTQYEKRLKQILKTYLNSKNLTKAINTYAIPVLSYSFGIIRWSNTDLNNIEIATRKQMTKYRKLHPKSCIQRITIPRTEGGRGVIDIHNLHNNQINNLQKFFRNQTSNLHRAIVKADKNFSPLNLHNTDHIITCTTIDEKKTIWAQKELHGRHLHIMRDQNIDQKNSYTWLQKGELYPETEGFAIAIQDQVILTKNYQKYILKDPNVSDDRCRRCQIHAETIDHIITGCPILAGTEYTERHNIVAKILHKEIANKLQLLKNEEPFYKYTPCNIIENEIYTLYWDIAIHTDKTIINNRPDITLINKTNKTTFFIEISTPNDTNIHRKYAEKIEKYIELTQEIKRIWKQKIVRTIPFIISANGILHKTFMPNLEHLEIDTKIHHTIQKSVILKTCNIARKFLNL